MEMNIEIVANLDLGQSVWARLPNFLYACSAVKKFSSVLNENIIYCFQWPQSSWNSTFLFSEIEDLPPGTQEQLYSELLDRDAQRELEEESSIINWSQEVRVRLGSRLHALWNRSAGDCHLDSVLQATWGVFDRDNTLRRAMSDSLHEAGHL